MKVTVLGAGAIGGVIAGYLKQKGEDVSLLARPEAAHIINQHGLKISGVRGESVIKVPAYTQISGKPELVILTTKTQDIPPALKDYYPFIKDALIVATQNGIRAEEFIGKYFPAEQIISSIVMFGATYIEPGKVVHNFEGSWIIGSLFSPAPSRMLISLSLILDKAFPAVISENIKGMKLLKVFVNANNCLSALLGMSMQEAFSDLRISRISVAIWKEALDIVSKAGVTLVSLPGFPVDNITKLTSMPHQEAARIFSGIMMNLSKDPLYGSIYQSIQRGRCSEIDYINGEFVRLAEENNMSAPLNKKLVEMVHAVEKTGRFLSKEDVLAQTEALVD